MGDDEEVEAAGLYTGLCSTSTESGFSSASAEEEKHSCRKVFDTELRSRGAVCTLALQEDDHWFHPVQVCSVPGPQSQWIVSVNAW